MRTTPQTMVIAEAGVNHNGELHLAKKLVDAAVDAGADVVKFPDPSQPAGNTICSASRLSEEVTR